MEFLKSSFSRSLDAAEFNSLAAGSFDPPVKIDGRYYAFPSTDKQKIDLNVKAGTIVNTLCTGVPPQRLCAVVTIGRMAC
jgi:hypothetical protein